MIELHGSNAAAHTAAILFFLALASPALSEYIGTQTASRLLGVCTAWAQHLADVGVLECFRDHAGRRVISRASVMAVARQRRAQKTRGR